MTAMFLVVADFRTPAAPYTQCTIESIDKYVADIIPHPMEENLP